MAINHTESKISVAVPDELVEFMADVFSRIESEDDSALMPSDDLLQGDGGYGGLLPDGKQYSFVFFPERGTRVRWEFTLLADEIDEIGSGWRKEMVVRRFELTDQTTQ
jgi:hypothetical protein